MSPKGYPKAKQEGDAAPTQAPAPTVQIPQGGFAMLPSLEGRPGATLLLDACNTYGVNPDTSLPIYAGRGPGPFKELLAWRFYPGNEQAGLPDSVGLVTMGGAKIRHYADPDFPMDTDTETRLRMIFHAFRTDPKTNEIVPLPLPEDLTLPASAVSGIGDPKAGHVFQGGYLRRKREK